MQGPTGGDAQVLCNAFNCEHVEYVEQILRKQRLDLAGYTFEFQRHADLVEALGLPSFTANLGYRAFGDHTTPEGFPSGDVIRT
jgi:hypothetical protein